MVSLVALSAIFAFTPAQRNHSQAVVSASPRTRLLAELSEQGVKSGKVTIHARRTLDAKELEEETPRNALTAHLIITYPFRIVDVAGCSVTVPTLEAARWWLERQGTALPIKLNAHMVKGVLKLNEWSLFRNQLVGLDVHSACRLTAVEGLSDCRVLERINVSHCRMLKDHTFLAALPMLRHLNVSANRHLQSLDFLYTSPCLETLAASECQGVKDWSPLASLSQLRRVAMRSSTLDGVAWAANCPMLEELDVSNCEFVVDTKPLAGLRKLDVVCAEGSNVVDLEGLTCCSHLEKVSIFDFQLSGEKASENKALLERSGTTVLVR